MMGTRLLGIAGTVCVVAFVPACLSAGQVAETPMLSISLEKPSVTQHEPVIAVLTLNNPTSKEVDFDLGYGYEMMKVEVTDPDGRLLRKPRPALANETLVFREAVRAPAAASAAKLVLLSDWFSFDKPGQYEIKFALPPSATPSTRAVGFEEMLIPLEVLPRDEKSLKLACEALVDRMGSKTARADPFLAASALSKVNDPAAVPFLERALQGRLFPSEMIGALARLKTPEAVGAIASASRSSDPEISSLAHAALEALDDRDGVK